MMQSARTSLALLTLAEVLAMSLWFISAALLPEMRAEAAISAAHAAALATAVQAGFVAGALLLATLGTSDRHDPRRLFAAAAILAAASSAAMVLLPADHLGQIALRAATGAALAGVYPVGMKIAVGWTQRHRGAVVGLLIGALTLGAAVPHLVALAPGHGWRAPVLVASGLAALSALLIGWVGLGPHHRKASGIGAQGLGLAWRDRRLRLAFAGYLGHMWELYAFWAWIAAALTLSFAPHLGDTAAMTARFVTFAAITAGAGMCLLAGIFGDRRGKARIARLALCASTLGALATAASFGGPPLLTATAALLWGAAIIPDSGQFSALVADAAPPEYAGSLLTLQTALGFLLSALTVQALPYVAGMIGWPLALAALAPGPLLGAEAMRRLIRLQDGKQV